MITRHPAFDALAPTGRLLLCAHATAADSSDSVVASHAFELSGSAPEWVQLLPAGTFAGRDGRGPYHNPDPEEVIRLTRGWMSSAALDALPIDYGHAMEGEDASAALAAGWITDLEARSGEVWGKVAWTTEGERRVTGREYRYLSPVFAHPREGEKRVLFIQRAGLTNLPNLIMQSVNSSQASTQENDVDLLKRIAAALGLSEQADEATVLARCSSLQGAQAGLTKVAASVDLAASATADEIVTAVQAASRPDPARYVPIDQFTQVSQALQVAQKKEGAAAVDQLIRDGKLAPAQRDWAISYHAQDAKGFEAYTAGLAVILKPGAEERTAEETTAAHGLDESQLAICSQLGVAPEDFKKNLEVTR